jgi:hypothetical protein
MQARVAASNIMRIAGDLGSKVGHYEHGVALFVHKCMQIADAAAVAAARQQPR